MIEEVVNILKFQAFSKGLKIIVISKLNEHINLIKTDGNRLRQILLNLLGNAIKFTKEGTVTLYLKEGLDVSTVKKNTVCSASFCSSNLIDESLKTIEIIIEDTGVGIPQEKL